MKKTTLILTLSLMACAPEHYGPGYIDPEFQMFVTNFVAKADENGHSISTKDLARINIVFDTGLKPLELANCVTGGTENPKIRVKPEFWVNASLSDREQVLFHEMGHCLLGIHSHDDRTTTFQDFAGLKGPVSIMNTYHMPAQYYNSNREYYIRQLFNAATPIPALYYSATSQFNVSEYVH